MYSYNFIEDKFWITLSDMIDTTVELPNEVEDTGKVEYYSSTGQFISNCFFFVEGIDSEQVQTRINEIYMTMTNLNEVSDIKHIENEDFISSYLFKYIIQNNNCNIKVLLLALDYLQCISEYLTKKIGIKTEGPRMQTKLNDNFISRCSYKFCHYTYYCQYNYPDTPNKPSKGCYSDHYVHHKLLQDIISLKSYIQRNYTSDESIVIRNNQEVIKCINTIAFVIKHMYDELWNIYISCKDQENYENYHRNISH